MGFDRYRATRDFHMGRIRRKFRAGEEVLYDGAVLRVDGKDHRGSAFDGLLSAGFFARSGPDLPVLASEAKPAPKEPEAEPPARVPYASPEAAERAGRKAEAFKPHVWSNDWLNDTDGPTCKVCGVTELRNLIRPDRKGSSGEWHHYRDAVGNTVTTPEELGCPVFIGDAGSAAAQAKEHVRRVGGRVDSVEGRVESVEDRLARLEAENDDLRARLNERPVIDAGDLLRALAALAEAARAERALETVQIRGAAYQLPAPVLDVFEGFAERVPEPAVIDAEPEDER